MGDHSQKDLYDLRKNLYDIFTVGALISYGYSPSNDPS